MTPQSEESKKRMEQLGQKAADDALAMCELVGYPTCDEPLCILVDETFQNGYKTGMQDPEANSERIKQLEGLLGECEKSLEVILYNNHASTLKFSDVAYKTLWKLQKLKAAKEGK